MAGQSHQQISALQTFSRYSALAVVVIGVLVLAGWATGIDALKTLAPNTVSMQANTAACMIFAGIALFLASRPTLAPWSHLAARICAAMIILIALLVVSQYLFGFELGIDQWLFREPTGTVGTSNPGRMAPNTDFNFILDGIALLLLRGRSAAGYAWAQVLSLMTGLVALLALISYASHIASFLSIGSFTQMALSTSITFILLSAGLLVMRPDVGLMSAIANPRAGGIMARRLSVAVIVVPIALGLLVDVGYGIGLYGKEGTLPLIVVLVIPVLLLLVRINALSLNRADELREQAWVALRESEQRYRTLIEEASEAILTSDHTGNFLDVNSKAVELLGYTREELQKLSVQDIITGQDRDNLTRQWEGSLYAGKTLVMERQMLRKDGTLVAVESSSKMLEDGRLQAIVRDISERKRAEMALAFERYLLNSLMENIPDSIYFKDLDSKFTRINQALANDLGLSDPQEAIGKSDADFFSKELAEYSYQDEQEIIRTGIPILGKEEPEIWPDGHETWVLTTKMPLSDAGGRIVGTFGVSSEITERKRAEAERTAKEAALAASRAKSEFLSRISHELRTPLSTILGFSQLLQLDISTPEQEESLGYIVKAGEHLLTLINEVLDISLVEAGKLYISIEPVSVRDVLHESLDQVQTLAAQRHITLNMDLAGVEGFYVMVDRQRLHQVLLHLLANAIKYNREEGTVYVLCKESNNLATGSERQTPQTGRLLEPPQAPAGLRIEVIDTGQGLTSEEMARLFTPFERLQADQGDVEGTGLGLALSKQLIEAMGGSIGVESESGLGSTFWIEVPIADGQSTCSEPFLANPPAEHLVDEHPSKVLKVVAETSPQDSE